MGQGSHLIIRNKTGKTLERTQQGAYQMHSWNFPERIAPGSEARVYIEFDQGMFKTEQDDTGHVTYTLQGTGNQARFEARKRSHFEMAVILNNYRIDIGWRHNGETVCEIYEGNNGIYSNYNSDQHAGNSWLGRVQDGTLVKALSIPGTHDSGTFAEKSPTLTETIIKYSSVPGFFGKWIFDSVQADAATCQTMSFKEQLNHGIRFLDIRLCEVKGTLYIQHGDSPTFGVTYDYTFDRTIKDVEDFLRDNPTEFVLMSIKKDYGPDFSAIWKSSYESRFCNTFDPDTTTVKDVRGKIVIISREGNIAGYHVDFGNNEKMRRNGKYWVQDNYDLKEHQVQEKKDAVWACYDESRKDKGQHLVFNFASMTGGGKVPAPREAANKINPWLKTTLKNQPKEQIGILAMDFPDAELIKYIYTLNTK